MRKEYDFTDAKNSPYAERLAKEQPVSAPEVDLRSAARRARDQQIAAEPQRPPLELPPNATSSPLEAHLGRRQRPVAVAGVVENGVVRPH